MKPWVRRLLTMLALVLVISYLLGLFDYWRVSKGKSPLFVFNWSGFFDGGTYAGTGFGYMIYSCNGIAYSMIHGSADGHHGNDFDYDKGPALNFWLFPFFNKSGIQIISHVHLDE